MDLINQITDFERYNIYVIACREDSLLRIAGHLESGNIPVINVGRSLAAYLADLKSARHLHIEAEDHFKKLVQSGARSVAPGKPPVAAIHNLGILFEPAIRIDATRIIKEISKSYAVVIVWDGGIDAPGVLHWGSQKEAYQLNFTDTPLKQVNIPHEI